MLIDKRTGQTRGGFTRCSGCTGFSSCVCPKPKPEKSKRDQYRDEVRAFDAKMAKGVTRFGNKSGKLR